MDMSRSGIGDRFRHPRHPVYWSEPPRVSLILPQKGMVDISLPTPRIRQQGYTIYEKCEVTRNSNENLMRLHDMGNLDLIVSHWYKLWS
jgi:hypothetical protein